MVTHCFRISLSECFEVEIYILKQVKNHHCTCLHVTRKGKGKAKYSTFSLH